ncbi:hypothetical protein [Nannocystis punicea]|uniref:PQQ-like domain-containing protein n=1 Tax=Nannocystis punicea TaxID=2995304 RepID=A0ABY7HI99_9BACT|nr:hypothetical protein [Nannocystis poenicansa]WAS99043.1 hypothetical protein O0S08_23180 [Nannocystis poenicansa]
MNNGLRILLIIGGVTGVMAIACPLMWAEGYEETMLKGPVVDTWSVPAFDPAPVVLTGASWASIPARTADGKVAGWVHEGAEGKFVALDEASGRVLWQVSTGPVPADLVRKDGWRIKELVPAVPLTLAGPGVYLVAGNRTWMLVAEGGASVKTGNFPSQVPPATGAACLVGGDFWISIADDRDGGVMLSAAGVLADVRSDRPAGCLPAGHGTELKIISALQNAHADPTPYAPDDWVRGYPPEVCGKYNKSKMRRTGNEWCSDMRTTDGDPKRSVMIHISDPVFREEDEWRMVTLPDQYSGGIDFNPSIVGFELSWPRAFFDMTEYRHVTAQNNPSSTSFEAKKVEQRTEVTEIVASIARTGELQWARSVWRGDMARVSPDFSENWSYTRSLLLASHAGSPTQNLYVFKPGMLLAVDQATGAPRFQVGAPLPPPTW